MSVPTLYAPLCYTL